MYLKKVYRYNKWMFYGMLFFVLVQLFCFYKKGMVFSPWYNYGMYSEVIKPQQEYIVTKVYANQQLLQGSNYSPQVWDRIHYNLLLATAASCNDAFYEKEVKRIFQKFHLPAPDKSHFVNRYAGNQIFERNKYYLANQIKYNIIEVFPLRYTWDGKTLVFKDSLAALPPSSFLCQ